MYIDSDTWLALTLLTLIAAGVWLWFDSLKAREQMLATCTRLCRDLKLQFLDETVTLEKLSLGRSEAGWPQFIRRYSFEFSGTGQDRWQGRATLAGSRVLTVQLDNPEGTTILGAGSPVPADIIRLSRGPESQDKHTLH
jgi:hypothetical protein